MTGKTISHYEILAEIGRGGMGVVYRAKDTRLGRTVALKFLPEDRSGDETGRKRLLQEAQSASALNHPNILTIHDIEDTDGIDFIVMEYVDGESLKSKIDREPLNENEAISIAIQVSEGLEAAHQIGIIHRDIKPANIMLTRDGRVKIMDFGLAKVSDASTLTKESGVVGTAAYMSPEQARGEKVDVRTDVWSLGVMLYEMISGTRPFQGPYMPALIYSVLNENPSALEGPSGPPSAEYLQLVQGCLQKEASGRYSSAAIVLEILQQILDGTRTIAAPVSASTRIRRSAWIGISIVLLALGFFWGRALLTSDTLTESLIKKVAILPIRAIGENQVSEQLTEGLHYSITSQLTSLRAYRGAFSVIPASDIRSNNDLPFSASDLPFEADIVVTGSIQRFDDLIQLRLELIDPASARSLDATRLEASMDNLLAFQDDVALALAKMLEPTIDIESERPTLVGSTVEPGAYDFYLRGEGYLQRFTSSSDVDASIILFQNAIVADTAYAQAYAGLGEAYWRKYYLTKDNSWATLAENNALKALSLTDDLSAVHFTLGLIQREQGRFAASVVAFQKAISLDPSDANTHVELGITYRRMDEVENSERAFLNGIRLRPDLWTGYNELGRLYYGQGRFSETIEQFQQVIRLAPDNQFGYNNLAVVYERIGEVEKAIPWFEKGISVLQSPMLYRNLGSIQFFDQQDFTLATATYQQAVNQNELDYKSWNGLGEAALQAEESSGRALDAYEHVVILARDALSVNSLDADAMGALSEALATLGRESEARYSLESMKRLLVLDDPNLLSIGIAHEVLGDRDSSLVYIQRALEEGINPKYVMNAPVLSALRQDARFHPPASG